jgi:hypothetical protein
MISLASGFRIYLACGVTDMRKGMSGLAMLVQQSLAEDPFDGSVFAFRGRRAGLIKLIWHDGVGLCMLTKLRIPTMPSRHCDREASTYSDLMASTVLRRWRPGGGVPAGPVGSCHARPSAVKWNLPVSRARNHGAAQ